MIINNATLAETRKGFSILFKNGLDMAKPLWDRVAMRSGSTNASTTYKWLGAFPRLREWLGDRHVKNLTAFSYTIANKDYESTVEVDRNDFEDDNLGVYSAPMTEMGRAAMEHRDQLVFNLLLAGFTTAGYDGSNFFATDHQDSEEVAAQSNTSTKKLTEDNFDTAYAAMQSFTDEKGKPLGITPNLLVVGPNNRKMALDITKADRKAGGATNVNAGIVEPLVVPWFGASPKWFLLDTTRAIKPLILQVRKEPVFTALDQLTDENVFNRKKFLYGVDDRKNVGLGLWPLAYGSTGVA